MQKLSCQISMMIESPIFLNAGLLERQIFNFLNLGPIKVVFLQINICSDERNTHSQTEPQRQNPLHTIQLNCGFSLVFLLGPTNGFTPRFLGFSVYVSNTTDKSEGTLCFKDRNYTVNTIPPVINITCPMHGQYVIYYNERLSWTSFPSDAYQYAFNELCEFEVYGMNSII